MPDNSFFVPPFPCPVLCTHGAIGAIAAFQEPLGQPDTVCSAVGKGGAAFFA